MNPSNKINVNLTHLVKPFHFASDSSTASAAQEGSIVAALHDSKNELIWSKRAITVKSNYQRA